VIVRKESTAGWSGGAGGSCANGLGHPEVEGVSTGVKFEVLQNPTSPIEVTVTPSASVHYWPPPAADVGTANVLVKVSAIVPKRTFEGHKESTTPVGKRDNILVGQLLRATVGLAGLPTGGSDEFAWSVSAGSPFNNYVPGQQTGTFFPFSPPNAAVAEWFFGEGTFGDPQATVGGTGVEVSCRVTLREPEPDIEFSLVRPLRVFEPLKKTLASFPVNPKYVIGTVQLLPDATSPHSLRLWGLECPGPRYTGMTWESAMTPVTFFSLGTTYEKFSWFQLGTAKLEWQRGSDPLRKNENYGLEGLDGGAPYQGLVFDLDGTVWCTGDAPGFFAGPMTHPDTVWVGMDFTFKLNLMYIPPPNGVGRTWVPLHRPTIWFCKGKGTNGSPWTLSADDAKILPNLNPARVFFQWTLRLEDGLDTWVPPP
jgi:hypothetical protein